LSYITGVEIAMREGCQEGYDEEEDDVLHGCGYGAIL
jgi:hypothetical protein